MVSKRKKRNPRVNTPLRPIKREISGGGKRARHDVRSLESGEAGEIKDERRKTKREHDRYFFSKGEESQASKERLKRTNREKDIGIQPWMFRPKKKRAGKKGTYVHKEGVWVERETRERGKNARARRRRKKVTSKGGRVKKTMKKCEKRW